MPPQSGMGPTPQTLLRRRSMKYITTARRRSAIALLAGGTLLAGLLLGGSAATAHSAQTAPPANLAANVATTTPGADELPVFTFDQVIADRLAFPTKELIFPSVFHAGEHLENPLAEWYIYYAPHDAPAGIYLMYSDSLDGPWTRYGTEPVISNVWPGVYDVSHVSSPDAVWNTQEDQLFLYFHGENSTTQFATSTDGVTFSYGDKILTTESVGDFAAETSYARVFDNPDTSSANRYAMFFMVNNKSNTRKIYVAFSPEGRTWTVQPNPIVTPGDAEGANVSAANLWQWNGKNYIVYGSTTGTMFAREVNDQLTESGEPRPLYMPEAVPPQSGRATSPEILTVDGKTHLFMEIGGRGQTTIAHALLDPTGVRDPLNVNPSDPLYAQCPTPGSDEFNSTALDTSIWTRTVRPGADAHRFEDGSLVLPTVAGGPAQAPLIQQPLPAGAWEVTTELSIDPAVNFQQAGLMAYQDDRNLLRIDLSHVDAGKRIDFIWRKNNTDRSDTWTMEDFTLAPSTMGDKLWLRMTSDGTWMTGAYSVDGITFVSLGRPLPAAQFAPTHVGPFAYRGTGSTVPQIDARFNWIRFTPTAEQLEACTVPPTSENPVVSLESTQPTVGKAFTFAGSGFTPGQSIQLWLHSDPVLLASLTASSTGTVAGTAIIPATVPPGSHKIVITDAAGKTIAESSPFTVAADPSTGGGTDPGTSPGGGTGGTDPGTDPGTTPGGGTGGTGPGTTPGTNPGGGTGSGGSGTGATTGAAASGDPQNVSSSSDSLAHTGLEAHQAGFIAVLALLAGSVMAGAAVLRRRRSTQQ